MALTRRPDTGWSEDSSPMSLIARRMNSASSRSPSVSL